LSEKMLFMYTYIVNGIVKKPNVLVTIYARRKNVEIQLRYGKFEANDDE
jgi:hypothetical protein